MIELRTSEVEFACPVCEGGDIGGDETKETAESENDGEKMKDGE